MQQIKGYEGLYIIDRQGNIYSLDRKVQGVDGVTYSKKGKRLSPSINVQNGYWQIDLWKHNKGNRFYLHRLVADMFIDNQEGRLEVNHINGNRLDCSVTNLEWVTSSENSVHAYRFGNATQKPRRKLIEGDYLTIYKRFIKGESFAQILKDFSISPGRLSVNLRALVKKWGVHPEYSAEILRQQTERAKLNGSN